MKSAPHLENVIWHALSTRQAGVSRAVGGARKFADDIGPLAGVASLDDSAWKDLHDLAANGAPVALFSKDAIPAPKGWGCVVEGPLTQMIRLEKAPPPKAVEAVKLGAADSASMLELTSLVRPGPFGTRTHELGNYFGVRKDGRLVAMAGERLKVPGYTEISAVCTHPDHLGQGYAAGLMYEVIKGIEARGETPFLHSRSDNDRAIGVYERLGFRECWTGRFAAFVREEFLKEDMK